MTTSFYRRLDALASRAREERELEILAQIEQVKEIAYRSRPPSALLLPELLTLCLENPRWLPIVQRMDGEWYLSIYLYKGVEVLGAVEHGTDGCWIAFEEDAQGNRVYISGHERQADAMAALLDDLLVQVA